MSARQKLCYLVGLNEIFLTPLASYLLLQIEQALNEIGISAVPSLCSTGFDNSVRPVPIANKREAWLSG